MLLFMSGKTLNKYLFKKVYIIKSYAKINLHLEVLNRRSDNYHNLFSLMAELELYDLLKLEEYTLFQKPGEVIIEIINDGGESSSVLKEIPVEKNLITIAVKKYMNDVGMGGHFVFSLKKNIPAGAGLGGGSSNAASALKIVSMIVDRGGKYDQSSVTPNQLMILAVGLIMMTGLKLFVDRSKLGKAMRATSQNQPVAALMGINVNLIISLTFAIGSALAAVAGVLMALEFKVYPTMGTMAGLKAFIAAVVGGIGNISGAMLGGIILGLLETFGVVILGIPQGLKDTIAFSVLILILLLKPSGILIKNIREKV